jgi:SAM-dependent methyltransferase
MVAIRQFVPGWARQNYRRLRRFAEHAINRQRTPEQVFSRIYDRGLWGKTGGQFFSGTGSVDAHGQEYVRALARYLSEHSIRRVVDLGCGDFAIGRRIADLGVDYTGVDVVPPLIRHHTRQFASPRVRFAHLDIVDGDLPDGDLCLIRQVLQHLSNDQIARILPKLRRYAHVLVTEHYPAPGIRAVPNKDKPHGHDTRIEDDSAVFLDRPPFNAKISQVLLEHETAALKLPGEVLRTFRVVTGAELP